MEKQFWAKRGKLIVGPFSTRGEAMQAFDKAYPFKGPFYMRSAMANQVLTGYGTNGPSFDMQWSAQGQPSD